MSTPVHLSAELRDIYAAESARIKEAFAASGDGRTAVARRAALMDKIILRLWEQKFGQPANPGEIALVAIGGYGRQTLFPHSDVDLLFLLADHASEEVFKDRIRSFSQELWDLGLKLS